MSIHNEAPLEFKECHFEAADTYAPTFKSILLDVVAADTSLDPASGDMLMKLFVFACMSVASSERSVSSPLLLSAQARGPQRSASAGFQAVMALALLPRGGWQSLAAEDNGRPGTFSGRAVANWHKLCLLCAGVTQPNSSRHLTLPKHSAATVPSQHSLTTSFGSDVINLFNILPNRDTIAKQRRFISLFLSPGHNLLSVFMTKLDRYDL